MSHIKNIELEIKDLAALKAACIRMGFTFMENQTTCNYYRDQKASCLHAIQVPGAAYEVGVVANNDGGYNLIWDAYIHGGLESALGSGAGKLKQAYGIEKTKLDARRNGFSVYERVKADGFITLSVEGGF